VSGSTLATIDATGTYTKVSDKALKQSIRAKNTNGKDYLTRILNLPVYSYAFNLPNVGVNDHANQMICIGVMADDLASFNGNCLGKKKYINTSFQCNAPDPTKCDYCNPSTTTVDYNSIFLYHILAFQQHVQQYQQTTSSLQSTMNSLVTNLSTTETNAMNALQQTITSQATQISTLQSSVSMLASQLSTLQTQYNSLSDTVTQMQAQITSLTKIVTK